MFANRFRAEVSHQQLYAERLLLLTECKHSRSPWLGADYCDVQEQNCKHPISAARVLLFWKKNDNRLATVAWVRGSSSALLVARVALDQQRCWNGGDLLRSWSREEELPADAPAPHIRGEIESAVPAARLVLSGGAAVRAHFRGRLWLSSMKQSHLSGRQADISYEVVCRHKQLWSLLTLIYGTTETRKTTENSSSAAEARIYNI